MDVDLLEYFWGSLCVLFPKCVLVEESGGYVWGWDDCGTGCGLVGGVLCMGYCTESEK